MADVKLLKYDGTEQQYPGVERVQLATVGGGTAIFSLGEVVEGIEIYPDFSAGDMPVNAPAGKLVKSAVIVKPENLTPENVRKGVNVAGIEGNMIGDTEEVTVPLNMPEGDQIILPASEGKVLSKVTVTKPETLVPENILAGVEIGGVTGTLDPPDPVETEIALDFSAGAMEVTPEAGTVFGKVNIPVPEGLVPENIQEGMEIAGIIGSMTAGGGIKFAMGTFVGTGTQYTLEHNLGVVPDIIIVRRTASFTNTSTYYLLYAEAFSMAYKNEFGTVGSRYFCAKKYSTTSDVIQTTTGAYAGVLDEPSGISHIISAATETTAKVGQIFNAEPNITYTWFAIGGLT